MLREGITVGIGIDSGGFNNSLDMLQSMKICALMHKLNALDLTTMDAQTVLEIATIRGAEALQLSREIESIEKGKKANIILVDLKRPDMARVFNTISNIMYSASGNAVNPVVVDCKVVMEDRIVKTINEGQVISAAQEMAEQTWKTAQHSTAQKLGVRKH